MKKVQRMSVCDTSLRPNPEQINLWELSKSNIGQSSVTSTSNTWLHDVDQTGGKRTPSEQRYCPWSDRWSCCIQGFLIGSLLAGLILAIIITFWLTAGKSTTTTSTIGASNLSTTNNTSSSVPTSTVSTSTTTTTTVPTCATWLWNTTGVTVAGNGLSGSTASQLNAPWNIYIDQTNNYLYIADSQNHRIQLWLPGAASGTTVAGTGSLGSTANLLNVPKDVFVDSSQNLYVADSKNQRIQFFFHGSMAGITVSSGWSGAGELWGVQVVAGSIYASDYTKSVVWKNGSTVAGNMVAGSSANQLNQPQGLIVDASVTPGTVYAVNSQQHTIVQWTLSATAGTVVAGVNGVSGSSSTLLKFPTALKLDSYTNMFVVDNNNHRIQLFCRYPTINTTARTIAGTGTLGQTPQTLQFPAGVAIDASLNLYVADTSNHRIQKFQRLQ